MSYNGIGLATARGSGTSGHVQRNLSFVRPKKGNLEYKTEEELGRNLHHRPPPNQDILNHDRKRQVELQCAELEEHLQESGELSEEQILDQVGALRTKLLRQLDSITTKERLAEHDTHHLAEAKQKENAKMMKALGIKQDSYVEGSAFDRELQERRKHERIAERERHTAERQQQKEMIKSSATASVQAADKELHKIKRRRSVSTSSSDPSDSSTSSSSYYSSSASELTDDRESASLSRRRHRRRRDSSSSRSPERNHRQSASPRKRRDSNSPGKVSSVRKQRSLSPFSKRVALTRKRC